MGRESPTTIVKHNLVAKLKQLVAVLQAVESAKSSLKMAWKHRAQAPRQYTTFLRDDETVRQNYLRLDDVTFKRLQLYERKMKGKTTEELLASVEKATKKNSEDLAKMNQAMYELAEDSKNSTRESASLTATRKPQT